MWSLRSQADLESFFVNFVFAFFHTFLIPSSSADVHGSTPCRPKGKFSTIFCISGIILSLIAELMALLICDCIRSIIASISRDILAFISPNSVLIDSTSLLSLTGSFLLSMSRFRSLGKNFLYSERTESPVVPRGR